MSFMPPNPPSQLDWEAARAEREQLENRAEQYAELHGDQVPATGLLQRLRARLARHRRPPVPPDA